MDAGSSLGRDVIVWRQCKTSGQILCEKVVERYFTQANIGILAGHEPPLDTLNQEYHLQIKQEAEQRKLHRKAKVYNILEMWQGSNNKHATNK